VSTARSRPEDRVNGHPKFARGGYIPGTVPVTLDPEECIVRATDVNDGKFVCCRASHAGRPCHEPILIPDRRPA
jgi:hypothetical protein